MRSAGDCKEEGRAGDCDSRHSVNVLPVLGERGVRRS